MKKIFEIVLVHNEIHSYIINIYGKNVSKKDK